MLLIEAPSKKIQETKLDDRGLGDTSLCTSSDFKHENLCRTRKGESNEEGVEKKNTHLEKWVGNGNFLSLGQSALAIIPS